MANTWGQHGGWRAGRPTSTQDEHTGLPQHRTCSTALWCQSVDIMCPWSFKCASRSLLGPHSPASPKTQSLILWYLSRQLPVCVWKEHCFIFHYHVFVASSWLFLLWLFKILVLWESQPMEYKSLPPCFRILPVIF